MNTRTEAHYIGVDLGRVHNHSAFCVLSLRHHTGSARNPVTWQLDHRTTLEITHVERVSLGTDYTEIVSRLARLARRSAAPPQWGARPPSVYIVLDSAGPGQVAVDLVRRARLQASIQPIAISAGEESHRTRSGAISVPRKDLLSTLRVLFEIGAVRTAAGLRQAEVLRKELLAIRHDGRQQSQDDTVFAAALAAWYATRVQRVLPLAA